MLHDLNLVLDFFLLLPEGHLPPPVEVYPPAHDCGRDGDHDRKVDPQAAGHDGFGPVVEVEKRHGEDRREVCPRQEQGAEEGKRLHSGAVPLGGVGQVFLLLGDLEVEFGFAHGCYVVELEGGCSLA